LHVRPAFFAVIVLSYLLVVPALQQLNSSITSNQQNNNYLPFYVDIPFISHLLS